MHSLTVEIVNICDDLQAVLPFVADEKAQNALSNAIERINNLRLKNHLTGYPNHNAMQVFYETTVVQQHQRILNVQKAKTNANQLKKSNHNNNNNAETEYKQTHSDPESTRDEEESSDEKQEEVEEQMDEYGLILFDMDNTSSLNDKLQYLYTDELMISVANVIHGYIEWHNQHSNDCQSHFFHPYEDQFIVLTQRMDVDEVKEFATNIMQLLLNEQTQQKIVSGSETETETETDTNTNTDTRLPLHILKQIADEILPITLSAGIAMYNDHNTSNADSVSVAIAVHSHISDWIMKAEKALMHSKSHGLSRITCYEQLGNAYALGQGILDWFSTATATASELDAMNAVHSPCIGWVDQLQSKLVDGANVNVQDQKGNTALMNALIFLFEGNLRCFNTAYLLACQRSSNPNLRNQMGKTALMLALEAEQPIIAQKLMRARFNPHLRDGQNRSLLDYALTYHNREIAIELINIYHVDGAKYTAVKVRAFFDACRVKELEYGYARKQTPATLLLTQAQKLLGNKNAQNGQGVADADAHADLALSAAEQESELRVLKQMIEVDEIHPDYFSCAARYRSGLHFAASKGNYFKCRYLIENGTDVNALDQQNSTPLHLCAFSGNFKCAQLLVANGAVVDLMNFRGWTPLLSAVNRYNSEGCFEICKLLLSHGANPLQSAFEREDSNALQIAADNKRLECYEALLQLLHEFVNQNTAMYVYELKHKDFFYFSNKLSVGQMAAEMKEVNDDNCNNNAANTNSNPSPSTSVKSKMISFLKKVQKHKQTDGETDET